LTIAISAAFLSVASPVSAFTPEPEKRPTPCWQSGSLLDCMFLGGFGGGLTTGPGK
jgi:hypothetical protein